MDDKTSKQVNATAQVLHDLGKVWKPYEARVLPKDHHFNKDLTNTEFYPKEGQKTIGKAILSNQYRLVFIQLGRQCGKSELVNGIAWYKGLLQPRAGLYYFAPKQKQAKEIVWSKNRIQTMNSATALDLEKIQDFQAYGKKYVKGKPNNQEMRLSWVNDSFIKVDGSDNYDEYRGISPHLVIFDEFREFRPGAYDAFKASTTTHKGTIVIISTPPAAEGFYTKLMKEAQDPQFEDSIFFQMPTWANPYQDLEELEKIRAQYVARGELDVWKREYCAEFVVGGSRSVFPMVKGTEFRPHHAIFNEINQSIGTLEFHCVCDPGSAGNGSAFAVLFAAYHPYTKQLWLLDEIYATKEAKKSVGAIEPEIARKIKQLTPNLSQNMWNFMYDEAATWFRNEMQDRGYSLIPTMKRTYGKDQGISLIKDLFLGVNLQVSDKCKNLMWELTNYVRDDKGNVPKKDDHLIDCFRYLLMATNYHITRQDPSVAPRFKGDGFGGWVKLEDDLNSWGSNLLDDDPYSNPFEELF